MAEKSKKKAKFVTHEQKSKRDNPAPDTDPKEFIPSLSVDVLPSKWLSYPPNSSISYKPYVFGEIKKFNQSKLRGKPRLDFIMSGIESSFPKEELTLADMLYIGLMRKISTLGDAKTQITFLCEHCGMSNSFILLNSEMAFDDIEAEKLPVVVTLSDGDYQFSPLTVQGYSDLMEDDLQNDIVHTLAKECINRPYENAYKRFYAANTEDGTLLDEIDELLYHGVTPMDRKCDHCEGLTQVEVEGGEILISPFRDDSEPTPNRIRFGV